VFPAQSDAAWRSETWISSANDLQGSLPSDDEVRAALGDDRLALTGRRDEPAGVHVARFASALPLYGDEITAIRARLADLPAWLALAGNYLGRLGAARLLDVAREAADRIREPARARRRRA
jgi:protoporphyrinogen oxidase